MKNTLRLLSDNILIEEYEEEEKFGIKSDSLSVKAEIMGIGPDVTDIDVGDIVYLSKYSGIPYIDNLRVIKPRDILVKEIQ